MVPTLDKNIKAEYIKYACRITYIYYKTKIVKKMKTARCWKILILVNFFFFFVKFSHLFCISKDNVNYIFCVTFSGAQGNIKEIGQRPWGISPFPTSNVNLWKSTIYKLFCIKCQIKSDFFWMSELQITICLCKLF